MCMVATQARTAVWHHCKQPAAAGARAVSRRSAAASSEAATPCKQSSQVCIKVLVALFRGRHGGAAVWLVGHNFVQL